MARKIFAIIFFIICLTSGWAQKAYPVTIKGTAAFAAGEEIRIIAFDDMTTYRQTVAASDKIDAKGRFLLTYNINQPTLIQLAIRTSKAEFYIEPGRTYDFNIDMDPELFNLLDPMTYGGYLQIRNNDTTLTEDINLKINYFERVLDFAIDHFAPNIIGDMSEAQFDSIQQMISERFPLQYSPNNFYKSYIYYTLASLERVVLIKDQDSIYHKYFDNEYVLYDNPAYMNFFYEFYNDYLTTSPRIDQRELRKSINENGTYLSLFNAVGQDAFLVNEKIRELAIIENLPSLYESPQFNKHNIIAILKQIAATTHFFEHKKIAENMLSDMMAFESGAEIEFKKMKTINGAPLDLEDHKGSWVYVQMFTSTCEDCIREMMIIDELHKKYGDSVVFISLSLDFNFGHFIQFKEHFPQFDWTFAHFNNRYDWIDKMQTSTLPDNLLIRPDGKLARRFAPDITTELPLFLLRLFKEEEKDNIPLNQNRKQ